MQEQHWRVIDVLEWSHKDLAGRGCAKPRLDAELLLGAALGLTRLELYTNFDRPMSDDERTRFREFVKRRRDREPIAYILGTKEFYSLEFTVTPAVLVPRPETELLVEHVLQNTAPSSTDVLVDVGTGSGCIAIAIARHRPQMHIVACDLSPAALSVARSNARRLDASLTFLESDLFEAFPDDQRFDWILSNPPYIETTVLDGLAPELTHEPRLALDGGPRGLDVIGRLVTDGARRLRPGGTLLFEIGSDQGQTAGEIVTAAVGSATVAILKDLAGLDRALHVTLPLTTGDGR